MSCDNLLNELKQVTCATFISDLKFEPFFSNIRQAISNICFDKYSIKEWRKALAYIGYDATNCVSQNDILNLFTVDVCV